MLINDLSVMATGRRSNLFGEDIRNHKAEIEDKVCGKSILVIGGAGSIGSATIGALLSYRPHKLHVIDQNENNLAELVRDLRSSSDKINNIDFRTLPIDYGSGVMHRFLLEQEPYNHVLNFAAIKHVRSEKDTYSILQMLDTNIIKLARLLCWLQEKGSTESFFSVSTDKAANPVNLMGASKRLMEHVIFSDEVTPNSRVKMTSARFANVAFSDGSLLYSFIKRMDKRQPLACPRGTKRFFISLSEAGQLCLLAAMCAPEDHLLIPRLDPEHDLHDLEEIAIAFLRYNGFKPRIYADGDRARASVESDIASGFYPLLLTELDTSGEKPYEEFVGDNEKSVEIGMLKLSGIIYQPYTKGIITEFLSIIEKYISNPQAKVSQEDVIANISDVVPEFKHIKSGMSLDDRM